MAKLGIYVKVEPKDFLVELGRIASRMAPGIFVLVFGLWVEKEESGRTGFPSGCTGRVELPFTGMGKPVK